MTDAMIVSARYVVDESLKDLRTAIEGLPGAALDWRPGGLPAGQAGAETNSVAVLATHVLHSTRWWLSVALGTPLPDRDRESEFRAAASDAAALLDLVDALSEDCRRLLGSVQEVDWAALRPVGGDPREAPAAFALLHAAGHLREHVGHIALTRQLWESRPEP
ncbi:MAG: DinB family protein [Dehalococcoidia bacterium]|nr:DinB family protein [Dehalococcoidia bacterium]